MAANSHSNSRDGDTRIPVTPSKNAGQQVIDLDEEASALISKHNIERQMNAAYNTLPSQKQTEDSKVLNFLGSSYSGVDIKVIAHLYGTQFKEAKTDDLEDQREFNELMVLGCTNLLGGLGGLADNSANDVLTFDERKQIFTQTLNLDSDPSDQKDKAITTLIQQIFYPGDFSFLGVAKMRRKAEKIQSSSRQMVLNLNDRIRRLSLLKGSAESTLPLASLQTISVSSHREKFAVRALGHSYAKAYTRGPRTIAGSMIFTIFEEHPLLKLIHAVDPQDEFSAGEADITTFLPDQLPPIDLTVVFANEYGSLSDFRLYGVEFGNDGATYSIEDLLSEEVLTFVARDVDIMTKRGKVRLSRAQAALNGDPTGLMAIDALEGGTTASSLLFNNRDYQEHISRLGLRRRLKSQ